MFNQWLGKSELLVFRLELRARVQKNYSSGFNLQNFRLQRRKEKAPAPALKKFWLRLSFGAGAGTFPITGSNKE